MQAEDYILKLSNTPFKAKEGLPKYPGIYYVVDDNNSEVIYIGKSVNINSRWLSRGHHRDYQLNSLIRSRHTSLTIYYEFVKVELLDITERKRIEQYSPLLNESSVKIKQTIPTEHLLVESLEVLKEMALILGVEKPRKDIARTLESVSGRNNLTKASILEFPVVHLLLMQDDPTNYWLTKKYLLESLLKRDKKYAKYWSKIYSRNLDLSFLESSFKRTNKLDMKYGTQWSVTYSSILDLICHRVVSNGYVFELTEWGYWNYSLKEKLNYNEFIEKAKTFETTLAGVTIKALSRESFHLLNSDPNTTNDPVCYLLRRLTPYEKEIVSLTQGIFNEQTLKQSKNTQIEDELRKILKRINKNTTLFPKLRSLIIGEYLEGETRCIVVAVSAKEYNSIFRTSMNKGKGGWSIDTVCHEFEGNQYQKKIYRYTINNYRFEFTGFFQRIDYMCLENRLEFINAVPILGAEVRALSSVEFIDSLIQEVSEGHEKFGDSYWFTRSRVIEEGSYVLYLRPKLKPLEGQPSEVTTASRTQKTPQISYGFTNIDELLLIRGKNKEQVSSNLLLTSSFVRQSAGKNYLPLLVDSFVGGKSSYYLVNCLNEEGRIHFCDPSNCQIVYLLARGDEKLWLLLGDELREFVKLATKENFGEDVCFVDKLYISPRRYVSPARVTIKIEGINYSGSIPFGTCTDFPAYATAKAEIKRRLSALDIPTLKFSFSQETVKS